MNGGAAATPPRGAAPDRLARAGALVAAMATLALAGWLYGMPSALTSPW
jgi:hypothetical protein